MDKLLVPCDFSKTSLNAYRFALDLARRSGATIHLLHAIELPMIQDSLLMLEIYAQESMMNELKEESEKEFERLFKKYNPENTRVSYEIVFGQLNCVIQDSIEKDGFDTLIMGSHGAGGLNEFFIGSNAEQMVRTATVPVIVVKHLFFQEVRNIVFPVSWKMGEQDDLILKVKELQEFFKAKLHLVWINTSAPSLNNAYTHERFTSFVSGFGIKNFTTNIHNYQNEQEGILHFAEMVNGDMIAMGSHGGKGIAYFLSESGSIDIDHNRFLIWTYLVKKKEFVEMSPSA